MSTLDPAEAILPTALALVAAVADWDAPEVTRLTANLDRGQMHALAVVLAAHVDLDRPITTDLPAPLTPNDLCARAIHIAAELYGVDADLITSHDRSRPALDARAVAMYATRLCGLSSPFIGARFNRDHSTVLHACGRVGETPRLRRAATRVAMQCGWSRDDQEVAS